MDLLNRAACPTRAAISFAIIVSLGACARAEQPMPQWKIDPARVSVSGISSGAYMAQQVHFAFADRLTGAGLIAGGPYGCAQGKLDVALSRCMNPKGEGPDVAALSELVERRIAAGELAPLEGFRDDRVWVFRGKQDPIVGESVALASAVIYGAIGSSIEPVVVDGENATHTFPTIASGAKCDALEPPFIGACGYDAAGEIFREVVGTTGDAAEQSTGTIVEFDQARFAAKDADPLLAETGFAYVPKSCESDTCGLHIAFHGCEQNAEKIGRTFIEQAGYNRWADLANVVVVYPQTRTSLMPLNPKGCWDWWGYTGSAYDTKDGAQIRWVGNLLDAVIRG